MNNPTQHRNWILGIPRAVAVAALALAIVLLPAFVASRSAQAQTYTYSLLYSFTGGTDGATPAAGLVQDAQGNLYGTAEFGGDPACTPSGCGTVFKLDTTGKETVLYHFTGTGGDGANPVSDLVLDAQGNLYGTTEYGGNLGYGTVFKLDTTGNETVLHSFNGVPDGRQPEAGLVRDTQGNLYGTTYYGGSSKCYAPIGCGTVFKVDTTGKETVIYSFTGKTGKFPAAGLVMDAQGNLYGTTRKGGGYNFGTVFEVDPAGKEIMLGIFLGGRYGDGAYPVARLVMDTKGNLYGTTAGGGPYRSYGTVFGVVHYNFLGKPDGLNPRAGLVLDAQGNLYGTTTNGGTAMRPGAGTVFKLDTTGKETVLYSFTFTSPSGVYPEGSLLLDAQGNLYGTTSGGGSYGYGTVFKLTP